MARTCPICQSQVLDDSQFCSNCGARLPAADANPTPAYPTAPPGSADSSRSVRASQPLGFGSNPPSAAPASAAAPFAGPPSTSGSDSAGDQAPSYPPYQQPGNPPPSYPPYQAAGYPPPAGGGPAPSYPPQPQQWSGTPPAGYPPYQPAGFAPPAGAAQPYPATGAPAKRRGPGIVLIGLGLIFLLTAIIAAVIAIINGTKPNQPTFVQVTPPSGQLQPTAPPVAQATPTAASTIAPTAAIIIEEGISGATGEIVYLSYSDDTIYSQAASSGQGLGHTFTFSDTYAFTVGEAVWSPDGAHVLSLDQQRNGAVLNLSDRDGSNLRQVASVEDAVPYWLYWSSDSRYVAFVVSDADPDDVSEQNVYVLDVTTSELKQLTSSGGVSTNFLAWSPDSSWLAYTVDDPDFQQHLHIAHPDGSDDHELTAGSFYDAWWLANGEIAVSDFCGPRQAISVCSYSPDGGAATLVYELDELAFYGASPDGQWLMLNDYNTGALFVANVATQAKQQVATPQSDDEYLDWGVWSPDNRYVTYEDYASNITYVYELGSNTASQPLSSDTVLAWLPEQ